MAEKYVSRVEIARQLRVTDRQVTNWVKDHDDFPSRVNGKSRTFPEDKCFDWYVKHRQREAVRRNRSDEPADLERAKARKMEAEAALAELQLAKAEGEVVTKGEFEDVFGALCDRIRAKVLNMPGRWAPQTVGKRSVAESLTVWQDAAEDVLAGLSETGEEFEAEADVEAAA